MTTPSGPSNFEYSDDSVVARLAFEIPPQAANDVEQITQAVAAMATQLEYSARSAGTWAEYMREMPQIMDRANQAYRETITQLERMSYIQSEMSAGGGGANVSPAAAAGPQGGGYSTAAPAGYVNPFAGQFFGMGVTPDLMAGQQQMGAMASQDPRMYANMMAARGMAVNPALLGMMGGTVAGATGIGGVGGMGGGQGWGAAAPGATGPQGTQSSRDSAAPPDPTQSGQTTQSEPQNLLGEPHPDSPEWVKQAHSTMQGAQKVLNEAGGGGGGRASSLLALAGMGLGAAGKWGQDNPNAFGGLAEKLGALKTPGLAAGVGAGGLLLGQNIGETVQKYEQLGSVQGGGAIQGAQYEMQARMLALNPFITTEQARQAMQMALSEGFRGGEYDTIQDYMLSNFKDLGVQFATSRDMAKQGIYGGQTLGEAAGSSRDLLEAMHQLSRDGGASFPARQEQAIAMREQLISQGMSPEAADRAALGAQEGYSENMLLRDKIPGSMQGAAGNQMFLAQVAAQHGITGIMPEALPAAMEAAGIDMDEAYNDAAKKYAYMAAQSWPDNRFNAIASFMGMMNQMGANLDYNTAEELFKKVMGEEGAKDPVQQANERVANMRGGPKDKGFLEGAGDFIKNITAPITKPLGAIDNVLKGDWGGAFREMTEWGGELNPYQPEENVANQFADSGRTPQAPPKTPREAFQGTMRTEGTVQGEVRITVDQQGRVSAPATIQLSGQQKSANAGYGSAQLNNAPPGDPTFHNAYNAFPEGGR